jgi:hypothetical protein
MFSNKAYLTTATMMGKILASFFFCQKDIEFFQQKLVHLSTINLSQH